MSNNRLGKYVCSIIVRPHLILLKRLKFCRFSYQKPNVTLRVNHFNILQLITAQRPSWKGKEIQLQSKLSENQCDSYSLCHLESLLTRDITITCVMQHLLDFARKRNTPIWWYMLLLEKLFSEQSSLNLNPSFGIHHELNGTFLRKWVLGN